jgi:KDO2-lipid IV(A) lauroyltransferase
MRIFPKATDWTLMALVELFTRATRMVPPSIGLPMGRVFGYLACAADPRHRNIARSNLKFALGGEKSDAEINRLVYQNFMQWGMIAFEWGRMRFFHRRPPGRLPVPMTVSGEAHLQAAKAKSPAVLLLSAHFGNWEYGHLHYAGNVHPLNFIVRRIDNPYVEKLRVMVNQHHGVTILYKEKGLKAAIKHLRRGEDLVIFADQKANRKEGIPCRFFGRETTTLPIVAALAQKYQYPIVPMFVVRDKNSASHQIVFLPELTYDDGDTVETIAQRQNDIIEGMIRKHPDHWLWMHRKWKTEYPEIYQAG